MLWLVLAAIGLIGSVVLVIVELVPGRSGSTTSEGLQAPEDPEKAGLLLPPSGPVWKIRVGWGLWALVLATAPGWFTVFTDPWNSRGFALGPLLAIALVWDLGRVKQKYVRVLMRILAVIVLLAAVAVVILIIMASRH